MWCLCLWSPVLTPGLTAGAGHSISPSLFFQVSREVPYFCMPSKVLRSQELCFRLLGPHNAAVFHGFKPTSPQFLVLLGSGMLHTAGGRSQTLVPSNLARSPSPPHLFLCFSPHSYPQGAADENFHRRNDIHSFLLPCARRGGLGYFFQQYIIFLRFIYFILYIRTFCLLAWMDVYHMSMIRRGCCWLAWNCSYRCL